MSFFSPTRDDDRSPLLRLATAATAVGAGFFLHKQQLATNPRYAQKLYNFFKKVEDRSPAKVLRTLHASEIISSYLPKELRVTRDSLLVQGHLTPQGRLYQRMLGTDLSKLTGDLHFSRHRAGSPYLRLTEAKGLNLSEDVLVRFGERGAFTGSATRLHAGVRKAQKFDKTNYARDGVLKTEWERFKFHRRSQTPGAPRKESFPGVHSDGLDFLPMYARRGKTSALQSLKQAAEFHGFASLERTQALLAKMGMGLQVGTYDKIAHMPFKGEGGLLNQLFSKRVLPIYAGLTYLGFADYLMGHRPSETLESIPAYLAEARASATDNVPFARDITDFYKETVPGPQYGPLALPAAGAFMGGVAHYAQVLGGKEFGHDRVGWVDKAPEFFSKKLDQFINVTEKVGAERLVEGRKAGFRGKMVGGALFGAALMLPFVPGMLGSRKTKDELEQIYSGEQLVPVRSGRWWEMGTAPWAGGKISYYRPHRLAVIRSGAEKKALWGSEANYWFHNPLINPIGYLMNPYALEEEHYEDRPYPVSSPAFSDVPLVGPLLAGTIGRVVKPPVYMHEGEWQNGGDYRLGSALLQPRGPGALPGPTPKSEFGAGDILNRETESFFEFIGFPGFLAQTAKDEIMGKGDDDIYLQSSREMTSLSRKFYELNLGAGLPLDEGMSTEPIRRFIQREDPRLAVNDIPNTMPSWLPGPDDYAFSLRHGDPYVKVAEGHLRLPGPGYEALHPEVEGLDPEDYPDVTKLSILADVAQGSSQYYQYKNIVQEQARHDTATRMEYDAIIRRVEEQQRSQSGATQRKFSGEAETVSGVVEEAGPWGFKVREYPGRVFKFSGAGTTAADMSALALGELHNATREQIASKVDDRTAQLNAFLSHELVGRSVAITTPEGAVDHDTEIQAVVSAGGTPVNRLLIDEGLAVNRISEAGPEAQALFGDGGRLWGRFAEGLAFQGDSSMLNPMRYIPSPAHTKLWQEREPLEQYLAQEVYGTKLRRWDRPLDDFIKPYMGGLAYRTTQKADISGTHQEQRDMDTLADYLKYLQGLETGILTKSERANVGADLFGTPDYLASTLPRHERPYFQAFLHETNPEKRQRILDNASPELARTLEAQWAAKDMAIAQAEGRESDAQASQGRLVTAERASQYRHSRTQLAYGDWLRSQEIAEFFYRRQLHLPDEGSSVYADYMDPEDVKVKLLTEEGYDYHDFGVYEDRMAMLSRKPYVDGAVRELVQPDGRSVESLRQAVEHMIIASHDKNPDVRATQSRGPVRQNSVRVTYHEDPSERIQKDIRRNPDKWQTSSSR